MIAVVRVRGSIKLTRPLLDTFKMLKLLKKNHCVILEDNIQTRTMVKKVEPYVTWGDVDDKTTESLKKKGDKIFRLGPPRKGYGRKGVKMPYTLKGAYGDRKEQINDLITRMI